jgi:hypothetical protein
MSTLLVEDPRPEERKREEQNNEQGRRQRQKEIPFYLFFSSPLGVPYRLLKFTRAPL